MKPLSRCRWHLPATHFLESWSDILASDGTPSIIQPVIEPLYGGRSVHDILSLLGGDVSPSGYDIVRMTWDPGVKERLRRVLAAVSSRWRRQSGFTQCTGCHRQSARWHPSRGAERRNVLPALPARSHDRRWTLGKQRLASGTPKAVHQANL